ncbi:hypothetical protein ACMX9J_25505 [Priestia sp. RMT2NF4]|uniref:hypothetical protein n=1 Tax=Priestia sp. RMT2NF4 TaxID=3398394 RepID=UPI003A4C5B09
MAPLTKQAKLELLRNLFATTENSVSNNSTANANLSIDLPGIDVDINLGRENSTTGVTSTSIRKILLSKLDQEVSILTTSEETVVGVLIAVELNYVVLVDNTTGTLVFVRIAKINEVNETNI